MYTRPQYCLPVRTAVENKLRSRKISVRSKILMEIGPDRRLALRIKTPIGYVVNFTYSHHSRLPELSYIFVSVNFKRSYR